MKAIKFFVMALCSSIAILSIVSCDKKNDDENNGTNSNIKMVNVYLGVIDEESMNLYDITLNAYNGAKCESISLTKENTTLNENISKKYETNVRTISITKVNGTENVDSVLAVVTPKSSIEEYINSKDPTALCITVTGANIIKTVPGDDGFSFLNTGFSISAQGNRWGIMTSEDRKGQIVYERIASRIASNLSSRRK